MYKIEYNNIFDNILYSDNPKNVINGSTLRHYRNIWGITEKLCKYFGTTKEKLYEVCEICGGGVDIKNYINNIDSLIIFCKNEEKNKIETISKNNSLIKILKEKRTTLCGVGTRKIKCFLNSKIKRGDKIALIYRKALECEDKNISAKDSYLEYQDKLYKQKSFLIEELINISKENGYIYGYQKSDVRCVSHVIFFEFPHMEQISWHNTLNNITEIPYYNKEWDGKINSTLDKIEDALNKVYGDEIHEKYRN